MKIIVNDYNTKDIIKFLRQETELTQKRFGEKIGLSGHTIQGYERGTRKYTFETLIKIAKQFGYKIIIEKEK